MKSDLWVYLHACAPVCVCVCLCVYARIPPIGTHTDACHQVPDAPELSAAANAAHLARWRPFKTPLIIIIRLSSLL